MPQKYRRRRSIPGPPPAPGIVQPTGWTGTPYSTLAFSDLFPGTALDLTKWRGNWLAGTNTAVTPPPEGISGSAAMDPAQVTVVSNELILTVVNTPATVNGHTYPYRSGLIQSDPYFDFAYGFSEARIWIDSIVADSTIANWPAWWTTGQTWPSTGEDDIFEGLGGLGKSNYHTTVGSTTTPDVPAGTSVYAGSNIGWNIFGSRWAPGVIEYYKNGVLVRSITANIKGAPHYLILNLSVGGLGGTIKNGGIMKCSYVKVWQ